MAAEPQPIDQKVFVPYSGGDGKRVTATVTSATYAVSGMGVGQGRDGQRVMVTNGGRVSAFIRFGESTVVATLDSYELLPLSTQPLGAPFKPGTSASAAVYFAVITESGTTTVSVTAGTGK